MKLAILGGGNMGGAIAAGAVRSGFTTADRITVSYPSPHIVEQNRKEGIVMNYTEDNRAAVMDADQIIVSVKPWILGDVLAEIAPVVDCGRQSIVSIVAGVTFGQLRGMLGEGPASAMPLFRVISNTAVSVGRSVTFVASDGVSPASRDDIVRLFSSVGTVYEVEEEQMGAVTALGSCAIAYALRYIDASVSGREQMGLDRDFALAVVRDTVAGALALLDRNGTLPQQEIDRVTTPGGLTFRGLEKMEECGFTSAVINGLKASE